MTRFGTLNATEEEKREAWLCSASVRLIINGALMSGIDPRAIVGGLLSTVYSLFKRLYPGDYVEQLSKVQTIFNNMIELESAMDERGDRVVS